MIVIRAGEEIGLQIRQLREQKGYTQEELANELFISQSYLRQIEHGKANPTVNMVEKIITFLNGLPDDESDHHLET